MSGMIEEAAKAILAENDQISLPEAKSMTRTVMASLASYYEAGIEDAGYGNRRMTMEGHHIAKTIAEELRRVLSL